MTSTRKQSFVIWAASLAAIPIGAVVFALLFGAISQLLQTQLNPHIGSLYSGVSGTFAAVWESAILLWVGALSGFALVHALGRRFRFGVGIFVVAAAILTLYPIWVSSAATLEFAGRKLWLLTDGAFLVWDLALGVLGGWMIVKAKQKGRFG